MRLQLRSLLAAVAVLSFFATGHSARAIDLYWQWSFTTTNEGSYSGYFVTDGGPYTSPNPAPGTYALSDFFVITTGNATYFPLGSFSNGEYSDPSGSGFTWDGTKMTVAYRPGATNGFNLYSRSPSPYGRFVFDEKSYILMTGTYSIFESGNLSSLQAIPSPVPEPSTYALGAIATGVMAAAARRRKARRA